MKVVIHFDLVDIKIYSIVYNQMHIITIKSIWFLKIFKKYHVLHVYCKACKQINSIEMERSDYYYI